MIHPALKVAAVAAVLVATVVSTAPAQLVGRGFSFRRPSAALTLRGGYALASAGSDVFSFSTEQLTIDRADFSSGALGGDVSVWVSSRVDLSLSVMYSGRNLPSEFRDWVDQDDLPIEQNTRFVRVPVSASLRWYLTPRGRSIGRLAWIPARYSLYVGAGGGLMWYKYEQSGDFVDFETLQVFFDRFASTGTAPMIQGLAGLEYTINPVLALSTEVRYQRAEARLGRDFVGFDRIDLSGVTATLGLTLRTF